MNNNQGQNALANVNNSSAIPSYRPRLIEFYGYEGEDFRHFQEILESFLDVTNITSDARKLSILKSQLRRAAKIFYEQEIVKENPDLAYDKAIKLLRNQYITPELIQSYELEFNEMYQGTQEHPQIFLARLREAAELANINSEAVIESRFRAGLLKEIKQFCIQCSSRTFKDWVSHAEGWWNANRPRKIAMVDNPFIPRNINNALIYQDDNSCPNRYSAYQHNVELIDSNEYHPNYVPATDVNRTMRNNNIPITPTQLSTMEVIKGNRGNYQQPYQNTEQGNSMSNQDIVNLIQQTIRDEINKSQQQPQYNRPYYRNNRYNHYNKRDDYNQKKPQNQNEEYERTQQSKN
ncbi:uncharacterized protein RHIMIDRAFT_297848 [Rhizopus microsporus ATCC 52813]|uniref:Retrotransposon gag domain-containing protein n=1 Tax=Rhizopus microsporus ATCC 52813 TaxID=1340429 RepID=A0A2G4SR42_RHIZD|nr:uncharacterized protein RHIMIDRAFT_297848 [Rhizopus microsporus ATCC 52813]PHZ11241.1 hypothetical protein RHIMIDRAFT_297848 [Rhizopus microsporus ATCC 52813]